MGTSVGRGGGPRRNRTFRLRRSPVMPSWFSGTCAAFSFSPAIPPHVYNCMCASIYVYSNVYNYVYLSHATQAAMFDPPGCFTIRLRSPIRLEVTDPSDSLLAWCYLSACSSQFSVSDIYTGIVYPPGSARLLAATHSERLLRACVDISANAIFLYPLQPQQLTAGWGGPRARVWLRRRSV